MRWNVVGNEVEICSIKIKEMKTYSIYLMIVVVWLSACNKAEDKTISLIPAIEDNLLNLYYPNIDKHAQSIIGGDGSYNVTSSDKTIVDVELIQGSTVLFEAKGLGDATVTIRDNSGKSYTFDVHVAYRITSFSIKELRVGVKGDNLTDEQKKEIEEKALATIPVQVNGGYELIYSNDDVASGELLVYTETMGVNAQKGTFRLYKGDGDFAILDMIYKGEERKFITTRTLLKDTGPVTMALLEDLTKKFKAEFPNVESLQTQQVIH